MPPVILKHIQLLANDAEDLQELVKSYLAKLEDNFSDASYKALRHNLPHSTKTSEEADGSMWLKALRFCPPKLIDLINSRACRGESDVISL